MLGSRPVEKHTWIFFVNFFFQKKMKSLLQKYDAVCQMNSERNLQLERAQSLVNQFWETYEELWPWLTETEMIICQLPAPALEYETLKQQQEEHRVSILPILKNSVKIQVVFCLELWSTLLNAENPDTYTSVEKRII